MRDWKLTERGEAWVVEQDYPELVAWLDKPDPLPEVAGELREMLLHGFREAVANGPCGFVDDALSLVSAWVSRSMR